MNSNPSSVAPASQAVIPSIHSVRGYVEYPAGHKLHFRVVSGSVITDKVLGDKALGWYIIGSESKPEDTRSRKAEAALTRFNLWQSLRESQIVFIPNVSVR